LRREAAIFFVLAVVVEGGVESAGMVEALLLEERCFEGEREGVGGGESGGVSMRTCPWEGLSIPSPLLLSDLALRLFAASALAAARSALCLSRISFSLLLRAAAPLRVLLLLLPVSPLLGDWLRAFEEAEEEEAVR
jgi:hypothetical protein